MIPVHYHWRRLDQGMRIAVAETPLAECAAFGVFIPAGSRNETSKLAGLAHFVEHMVFKQTERRSARDISLAIEGAGGQINASTGEDSILYEARGGAEMLPVMADVLGDMTWNATFPEKDIRLEREVIREEIVMYRESPADHIGDLLSQALWPKHPLGHPISGSNATINRIGRDDLVAFRDLYHFSPEVVIAVAGPYSIDQVVDNLAPLLPRMRSAPPLPTPFSAADSTPKHLMETRDTEQLQLALAWHTVGRHAEDRFALRVLSLLMGETSSSRLFQELRENRGLCYQVGTDVTHFEETGSFEITAGLEPESRDESLETIERECEDLVRNGPTQDEVDRAIRYALGQSRLGFESTAAHMAWAGECLMQHGRIPAPDEMRAKIAAVTVEDVHRVAIDLFRNKPRAQAEILPEG